MKATVLLLATFAILSQGEEFDSVEILRHGPPPPQKPDARAATPKWGTILQKVNNFDSKDRRTWKMRYISNSQFFQPDGPIFIMLGAEWTIDEGWLQSGYMFDMARQNGADMYYTEHRFYGNSLPTTDLTVNSLRYLSTPQALADVAWFIKYIKRLSGRGNSKVVVFGGSYGGNMAIWMRERYPDVVHAAVSSSAPVNATVDFKGYHEVVREALADPKCHGIITNAVSEAKRLLRTGDVGIKKVQKDFNTCKPVNVGNFYDMSYFFNSIGNIFAGIVQSGNPNEYSYTCSELMYSNQPDDYSKLAEFVRNRRTSCSGNYDNMVRYYAQVNSGNDRPWIYQTCNEYGYFATSSSSEELFLDTFPVELDYRMCQDVFGASFDKNHVNMGATVTNLNYGGLNPRVTRVISVHGGLDPWHAAGLQKDVNADAPVIIVPQSSHCQDMFSISSRDSAAMRSAKLKEQEMVRTWLQQS